MEPLCGNCFGPKTTVKCQACQRPYCSSACLASDANDHQHYCGVAGQPGEDFELKDSLLHPGKIGIFALREFQSADLVVAEIPIHTMDAVTGRVVQRPSIVFELAGEGHILQSFPPEGATVFEKLQAGIRDLHLSYGGGMVGFMPTISRAQHHCIGNTFVTFHQERGVAHLRATMEIPAGTEVTMSYTQRGRSVLKEVFGIECQCDACTNPETNEKLQRFPVGQKAACDLIVKGKYKKAIKAAKNQIDLCRELGLWAGYQWTVQHDMMEAMVWVGRPLEEIQGVAAECNAVAEASYEEGDRNLASSRRMKADPAKYFDDLIKN